MTKGRTKHHSQAISDAMKIHWIKRRQKMALAKQGMVLAKRNRQSIARNVAGRGGRPGRGNGSGGSADNGARVQLLLGDLHDVRNRLRDVEDQVMSLLKTAIPLALNQGRGQQKVP